MSEVGVAPSVVIELAVTTAEEVTVPFWLTCLTTYKGVTAFALFTFEVGCIKVVIAIPQLPNASRTGNYTPMWLTGQEEIGSPIFHPSPRASIFGFTFPAALVIFRSGDGMPPGVYTPNRPQGLMMPTDTPATGR